MKEKWLPPHMFVIITGGRNILCGSLHCEMTKKEFINAEYGDDFERNEVMATSPDWDGGYTTNSICVVCEGYTKECHKKYATCRHLGKHESIGRDCNEGAECGGRRLRCKIRKEKKIIKEESPIKVEIISV